MKLVLLIIVFVITNLICFLLMRYDKQCARQGKRRVPEKTLFLSAILFGGLGGTLAMYCFHHKTKHWYFKAFFPALMIIQLAAVGFLAYKWLS